MVEKRIKEEDCKKFIMSFHQLCENTFSDQKKDFCRDRFMYLLQLQNEIQKKRGAYSENMRNKWINIMYISLTAPDCFFLSDKDLENKKWTDEELGQIVYYCAKCQSFQLQYNSEQLSSSIMVSFIKYVRSAIRLSSRKKESTITWVPAICQALQEKLCVENCKKAKQYAGTIERLSKKELPDDPIIALFLPFFIWGEFIFDIYDKKTIIKDANLKTDISNSKREIGPFTWLDVSIQYHSIWNIRSTPFQPINAKEWGEAVQLYADIRDVTWDILQERNESFVSRYFVPFF